MASKKRFPCSAHWFGTPISSTAIIISIGWSNFWPRARWERRAGHSHAGTAVASELDAFTNIEKTFGVGNSIFRGGIFRNVRAVFARLESNEGIPRDSRMRESAALIRFGRGERCRDRIRWTCVNG